MNPQRFLFTILAIFAVTFPMTAYSVMGTRMPSETTNADVPYQWILFLLAATGAYTMFAARYVAHAKTLFHAWVGLGAVICTMIITLIIFAGVYLHYEVDGVNGEADAIYFSIVTFTTLGYGEITPNEQTKLFAATEALLGYIYMGLFVSSFYKCITMNPQATETN